MKSLWIWVVLMFLLLLTAWGTLIAIAAKHRPASVPVDYSKKDP